MKLSVKIGLFRLFIHRNALLITSDQGSHTNIQSGWAILQNSYVIDLGIIVHMWVILPQIDDVVHEINSKYICLQIN